MPRFVAHLIKETRDQRAVLIAVFAALPVLTFLAFWGLTEHLLEADVTDAARVIVPVALALYLLAMTGDVFAADTRRGTIDFLRRQPGGLGHAFLAKVALTTLGLVAVFFWQALWLEAAWWLWGRTVVPGFGQVLEGAFFSPFSLAAVLLATWVLLTSTWLKQGGIALLLAPMLAAALGLPAFLWGQAHPVLVRFLLEEVASMGPWLLGLVALLPLTAAAWSWLGGRRVVRSAWSAVWRGLAAVLVFSGVAYAGSAVWISEQLDLTPASSDLHIANGRVSRDGGRLYLKVHGDAHRAESDWKTPNRTPTRTWVVDVETGAWNTLGDWGDGISGPRLRGVYYHGGWAISSLAPLPKVVQYRVSPADDRRRLAVWIDADSGSILKTIESGVVTKDVAAWLDEAGRAVSWVRDAEGRPSWMLSGSANLRRDAGDGTIESVNISERFTPQHPVPGGWYGWERSGREKAVLDATAGEVYACPFHSFTHVLGPRRVLRSRRVPNERRYEHVLLDPKTGGESPARGGPDGPAGVLCAVNQTTALCLSREAPDAPPGLWLWNPVDGTRTRITKPDESVDDVWLQGRDGRGRVAIALERGEVWDVVVLDPVTLGVTTLARGREHRMWLLALFPDDTAYGIEAAKRVVRYGPGLDDVEVVFPR